MKTRQCFSRCCGCYVKMEKQQRRTLRLYETFRHRTRRAGRMNGLHGEESNMRFDQHDDQIFQMSPLEELEQHAMATSQVRSLNN
jgi:hypothetical protein